MYEMKLRTSFIMQYLYRLIAEEDKNKTLSPFTFLLKSLLCLCSFIYSLAIRSILLAYKIKILPCHKLNCAVISVGNITWGGTGKTPLVEMIVRQLDSKGKKVAILSRGYKKIVHCKNKSYGQRLTPDAMGDEPYLLKKNLPHIPVLVGRDRVATGKRAVKECNIKAVILDDGFQYWRLFRDLDIVAINASSPFGNAHLLPWGILREPLSSLRRADIFMLTKVDLGEHNLLGLRERLEQINSQALIVESVHQPLLLRNFKGKRSDLKELKGRRVCLLSSIADPLDFQKTVSNLGAKIDLKFKFPDHYNYRKEDIERIVNACRQKDLKIIVTTEKDAVRLSGLEVQGLRFGVQTFILRIEIRITKNEREFFDRLHRKLY